MGPPDPPGLPGLSGKDIRQRARALVTLLRDDKLTGAADGGRRPVHAVKKGGQAKGRKSGAGQRKNPAARPATLFLRTVPV